MKIALVASGGGHLSELVELAPAWRGRQVFFVTTVGQVVASELARRFETEVHIVSEATRSHPFRLFVLLSQCVRIILRERPDVVLSAGAAPGCLMCLLGKLMGAKVIWIDSIANTERPSLSGRIVRHIADLFIVQWPDLVEKYPGVEYHGEVV